MKLASFLARNESAPTIGVMKGDTVIDLPASIGDRFPREMKEFLQLGEEGLNQAKALLNGSSDGDTVAYPLADIELLAPVQRPGKIIHTSCNFGNHLSELTTWKAPEWQAHNWGTFHHEHPTGFLEAPSSVVGSGAQVGRPLFTKQLDYEIELAIVIGARAKNVTVERALDFVAGYTIFNDLSARDIQAREHANKVVMLGKSFDGSCPLGPFLVTTDEIPDPRGLAMTLDVNGEVRQSSNTSDMLFKPRELVSWWSLTTLEPGDVITSGSPAGVAAGMKEPQWLKPGDTVNATIAQLGTLVTHIVEGS